MLTEEEEKMQRDGRRFSVLTVPTQSLEQAFYDLCKPYIKCTPEYEQTVRKEIIRIVGSKLPPSIPFDLISMADEKILVGSAPVLVDLFTLLSVISLFITVFGIYSAITLDTQCRQKEVAIRKVNGAGSKEIALIFGKLYIRLTTIAAIPALASVYLFLQRLVKAEIPMYTGWINTPLLWLSIILFVSLIIFITVAYRIWLVSRLNPADVIKTE